MHDVEDDGEQRAGQIGAERQPPDQLLVQLLLEVLQHDEAECEAGGGAGQVGHVADGRLHGRQRRQPVVDGETDVEARDQEDEQQTEDAELHVVVVLERADRWR